MKILIAHNAYRHSGGEDAVVDAEIALLREYGHEVQTYRRHNDELMDMPRSKAALSAVWSRQAATDIARLCASFLPDVIHVHNTFPLISPSVAWVAARNGIPLIQTLHNFRLLCPQATLLRDGRVCEDCIGKLPWRAIAYRCYRDSTLQSAVAVGMLTAHRALGTYSNKITHYIALNDFCREKFIEGGLPPERLRIKPHFVTATKTPEWDRRKGGLFIGRLSPEKGVHVLISAIAKLERCPVRVVGAGPLESIVTLALRGNYLGFKPREQVLELLHAAQYLVAPSTCYETFGLAIVEAFACGTPAIASRHGSYAELVRDGVTGLLFTPGDADDLADKIAWAESHPDQMSKMGQAARRDYEAKYTPQRNYRMLIELYEDAIRTAHDERKAA